MYTVLIPVKTEHGLEAAQYVIELPDSPETVEVVVLNVFERFEAADEAGEIPLEDLSRDGNAPDGVVEAARALEDADIDVTVRREQGDPIDEILRVADEIDADTIAMAGPKRSPTGKLVFGSIIQGVLLNANRPVTVLRRE